MKIRSSEVLESPGLPYGSGKLAVLWDYGEDQPFGRVRCRVFAKKGRSVGTLTALPRIPSIFGVMDELMSAGNWLEAVWEAFNVFGVDLEASLQIANPFPWRLPHCAGIKLDS